jgi:WD40 repeat protein
VSDVVVTPETEFVVSASNDNTLRIWSLRTGQFAGVLKGHTDAVHAVRPVPGGHRVISASSDRTVRVWDLHTQEQLAVYVNESVVSAISHLDHQGRFACGSLDGLAFQLRVMDSALQSD